MKNQLPVQDVCAGQLIFLLSGYSQGTYLIQASPSHCLLLFATLRGIYLIWLNALRKSSGTGARKHIGSPVIGWVNSSWKECKAWRPIRSKTG